jgi:hypothetical protein
MSLTATGDFSEARLRLDTIIQRSGDPIWQEIARKGLSIINGREQYTRRMLDYLFEV